MNLRQDKKYVSFNQTKLFFKDYGAELTAWLPAIGIAIAGFETRFAAQTKPIMLIRQNSRPTTIRRGRLKAECFGYVWKLTSALQYYYNINGDDVAANNVAMTEARLRKLSIQAFYLFSQMVMVQYKPALHNVYGLVEQEMETLRTRLIDFPFLMKTSEDQRQLRKKAGVELNEIQKDIHLYLKKEFDPLMEIAKEHFDTYYDIYRSSRYYGFVSASRGKPRYAGKLEPGEQVVLIKNPYRRRMAVIVSVTGPAPVQAGLGVKQSEMHGTPYTFMPGQKRRRICQKLAPAGDYIMLLNVGEEATAYEVWLKEGS